MNIFALQRTVYIPVCTKTFPTFSKQFTDGRKAPSLNKFSLADGRKAFPLTNSRLQSIGFYFSQQFLDYRRSESASLNNLWLPDHRLSFPLTSFGLPTIGWRF